jgi:hypothetical protein
LFWESLRRRQKASPPKIEEGTCRMSRKEDLNIVGDWIRKGWVDWGDKADREGEEKKVARREQEKPAKPCR